MKTLAFLAFGALLAGCASNAASLGPSTSTGRIDPSSQTAGLAARSYAITMQAVPHGKLRRYEPWMERDVNQHRLLYASDFNNSLIDVYEYPSHGTLAGMITTNLLNPQGMCIGNNRVYVANTGDNNVLGYDWGNLSPAQTLENPGEYPVGCSYDNVTGSLAASDIFSPTTGEGAVTIWPAGSNTGTVYVEPGGLIECYFIGYDGTGDVYVDGLDGSGDFSLAYLPAGSTNWLPVIAEGASINFPGSILWDGKRFLLFDQAPSGSGGSYTCRPHGATLSCKPSTIVFDRGSPTFVKAGRRGVVGADADSGAIFTWPYPAGGEPNPRKTIYVQGSYISINGAAVQVGPE
jgi:hypothetical protein